MWHTISEWRSLQLSELTSPSVLDSYICALRMYSCITTDPWGRIYNPFVGPWHTNL